MITFEQYTELLEDRPRKFTPEDVNYRDAESIQHRCLRCIHFYERSRDNWGVCEIMRPEGDEPVSPDYVCDFYSIDGEDFPFRKAR